MKTYRYAERAARLLRAARRRIGPRASAAHVDTVTVLAEAIRGTTRRRTRRGAVLVGAALGMGGLVTVLGWSLIRSKHGPSPVAGAHVVFAPTPTFVVAGPTMETPRTGGPGLSVPAGTGWRPGQYLRTGEERAFGGDSRWHQPRDSPTFRTFSCYAMQTRERWLRLRKEARSDAQRQQAESTGERFVISTPDAEVEVRGTRFRVAVVPSGYNCSENTVTRVAVTEGIVVVRSSGRESRVQAGGLWPSGCPEQAEVAATLPPAVSHPHSPHPAPRRAVADRAPDPEPASPSPLATENDLFDAARKAESAGDKSGAVRLLDVLLARFPLSPLKESAALERERLGGSNDSAP